MSANWDEQDASGSGDDVDTLSEATRIEAEWEEFTGPNGEKLMINPITRQLLGEGQHTELTEQQAQLLVEEEEFFQEQAEQFTRVRQNSAIFNEAWTTKATPGTGVAAASGQGPPETPTASTSLPSSSSVPGQPAQAGAQAGTGDDLQHSLALARNLTVDTITDMLVRMTTQLDKIVDNTSFLSDEQIDQIRKIRAAAADVNNNLEDGRQIDDRNDVDALINYRSLRWDWSSNNPQLAYYRAGARLRQQAADQGVNTACRYQYTQWHMPECFSDFPLPAGIKDAQVKIRLPRNSSVANTRVQLKATDTVMKLIEVAAAKSKTTRDATDYVVKAEGLNDYMTPSHRFFSYSFARRCLRDGKEFNLQLLPRPEPLMLTQQEADMQDMIRRSYTSRCDNEVTPITEASFTQISQEGSSSTEAVFGASDHFLMSELHSPWRVRVVGLDSVASASLPVLADVEVGSVYLELFLFSGVQIIEESLQTTVETPLSASPRFCQLMHSKVFSSDTLYDALPRDVKLGVILWGKAKAAGVEDKSVRLAYVVRKLVQDNGQLSCGDVDLRMWAFPGKKKSKHKERELDPNFIFRATTAQNLASPCPAKLRLRFDTFAKPVVAPVCYKYREPNIRIVGGEVELGSIGRQADVLDKLIKSDPLRQLSADDKRLLWMMRHSLTRYPHVLPKFLQSVRWGDQDHAFEAHRLLRIWAPPFDMVTVLELLDVKYSDYVVRKYAVNCLRRLADDELQLYLLQLTQCLKFEASHDSCLSRWLIERALRSPYVIGHYFFWHLKAELHNPEFCERYALILEEYLSNCGRFAGELRKQNNTCLKLEKIASLIVRLKREEGLGDEACTKVYQQELHKLNKKFFEPMKKFQVPLDPKWEASTLIVERCRYMSSKMVPLLLVFNNADEEAPPIIIMFKSGDDLRQDILTLQMLRIMDKLWLSEDLDMRLTPYKCIATGINENGEGVGMIEIVLNSNTTSGIQLEFGGGAVGAFKLDPIDAFLRENTQSSTQYQQAVDNFVCSCAGYCVATFVLGIGDRHNGNIMVTKDGHLFHIDFGHFLGNFKKKFGVNRERAAFVFTPEMAYVMGGKKYKKHKLFTKFQVLCLKGFKVLRANAQILETLFMLMVSAGMPELMLEEDITYMRDKLYLDAKDKQADKLLMAEVNKSLDSTYRRFDNMIHNFKHGN